MKTTHTIIVRSYRPAKVRPPYKAFMDEIDALRAAVVSLAAMAPKTPCPDCPACMIHDDIARRAARFALGQTPGSPGYSKAARKMVDL